jgi:hypothetical protein
MRVFASHAAHAASGAEPLPGVAHGDGQQRAAEWALSPGCPKQPGETGAQSFVVPSSIESCRLYQTRTRDTVPTGCTRCARSATMSNPFELLQADENEDPEVIAAAIPAVAKAAAPAKPAAKEAPKGESLGQWRVPDLTLVCDNPYAMSASRLRGQRCLKGPERGLTRLRRPVCPHSCGPCPPGCCQDRCGSWAWPWAW